MFLRKAKKTETRKNLQKNLKLLQTNKKNFKFLLGMFKI